MFHAVTSKKSTNQGYSYIRFADKTLVQLNLDIVDLEIVEFLAIVDKTILTIFPLSKIPCYIGIFMIPFVLI